MLEVVVVVVVLEVVVLVFVVIAVVVVLPVEGELFGWCCCGGSQTDDKLCIQPFIIQFTETLLRRQAHLPLHADRPLPFLAETTHPRAG